MKTRPNCLLLIGLLLLSTSSLVSAVSYPTLGFTVPVAAPKFNSLSSTIIGTKGVASLNLEFVYTGNSKFSCTSGSTNNSSPVICTGVQTGSKYTLSIKSPDNSRINLSGAILNTTATATASYTGSASKLKLPKKVTVVTSSTPAPLTAEMVIKPTTNAAGKLTSTSTGRIKSPYTGQLADVALTGSAKKPNVTWSLKYPGDKVSFTGKENKGNWVGKLTGNVGPSKLSKAITIPLVEYNTGTSGDARFYGTVSSSDGLSQATSASSVTVAISSDRNNNGSIESDETVTTLTDSKGGFDKQFAVIAGHPVTVDFDLDGYSKTPKVYATVTPGTEVPINTTLRKLETLAMTGASASSPDNKLQLENLPSNVKSLTGKVFNPVTETAQFPGEFADSTGNMLISSVFSAVEAKDANGNPVTTLSNNTKIKMQVPTDTWNTLRDLSAGNGQIDVPLYYYDEKTGEWKRSSSDGWLEDEAGTKLAENALSSLANKTYVGNILAVGNIAHLSYWNIDWPIATHGCVAGRLVDSSGNPVSGAVLSARGTTYTGSSSPQTTTATGRFCVEVMRSEGPAEDLNNNGTVGEESKVSLTVFANGKYYDLGTFSVPPTPATCATSGCKDLGDIKLEAALEVSSQLCTINGKVVYSGTNNSGSASPGVTAGSAVAGAFVYAWDSTTTQDLLACYSNGLDCSFFTTSNSTGDFQLKVPVLLGAEVLGVSFNNTSGLGYFGTISTQGCPTAPVTLGIDFYGNYFGQ